MWLNGGRTTVWRGRCFVNVKATKATQIVSEHHLSCTTVSKSWISPAPSPSRDACVRLIVPIIYLWIAQPFLRKQLAFQTLLSIQVSPGDVAVGWQVGLDGLGCSALLCFLVLLFVMELFACLQIDPGHAAFVEGRKAQEKKCAWNYLFWGNAITVNFLLETACEQRWTLN